LPPQTTDGRDAERVALEAAQRKNARRLGALLALVAVSIAAAAFAFVLANR
jgi:hypothetical protein